MKNQQVSIIMYHYIRDLKASRYPEIKGLDLSLFRQQLDFLQLHFHFITVDQLLDAALSNGELPENSVLLTFDDGYIDHYTHVFPLLKERGIQGFFSMPGKILAENKVLDVNKIHFILASTPIDRLLPMVFKRLDYYRGTEYPIASNEELYEKLAKPNRFDSAEVIFIKRLLQVELEESLRGKIVDDLFHSCMDLPEEAFARELYMSMDQVKLMCREGMVFGIHGYEHYWMNRLTPEKLQEDVQKALDVFQGIVPQKWICCYPYGSCSEEVVKVIQPMGAILGLTTQVRPANLKTDDIFWLPRFDTNDFPPKSENYRRPIK